MARDRKQVRAILELMEQGLTNEQIGEALGIHSVTVARSGVRKEMDTVRGMFNMLDAGFTMQEIGDKFHVSKQRVSQVVGADDDRGTRGKKVAIDASPVAWDRFMDVLRGLGITVHARPGIVDSRAVSEFISKAGEGDVQMKVRKFARTSAKPKKVEE